MKRHVLSLLFLSSLFLLGSCGQTHTSENISGNVDAVKSYTVTFVNYDGSVLQKDSLEEGAYPKYNGSDPVRKGSDGEEYTFTGWSPKLAPVDSDITYTAQFTSVNSYTITWVNWDGSVLETDKLSYGEVPSYDGENPVRNSEDGKNYTFAGWSPKVVPVYSDITYTAQFTPVNSYTVTWLNWDGSVLETDELSYGEVPSYDGEDPVRNSENGKTYTFVGWSPKVVPVYSDITYTAQFSSEKRYTVTWKNWDGTILELDQGLSYGDMPSYDGLTPTKPDESRLSFTFTGWTPEVTPVDSDVTYWANFTSAENTYTVTWLNYDGSVLETDTDVKYGTMPSYDSSTPSRSSSGKTSYVFTGWSPSLSPVYADITYTAQFREDQVFTVTWLDYDGTVLEKDTEVPYGAYPSFDGETPTREAEDETSYRFSNWYPYPSAVYSDVTYTAQYSSNTTSYTITFKDENGVVYHTSSYTKGTSVDLPNPTKKCTEAGKCYVLKGWYREGDESKTLVDDFSVQGDATYIALFELTDQIKYRVLTKPNGERYCVVLGLNDPSVTDIEIPSTYQGVPVTSIGAWAFQSKIIQSINIPESVTTIGKEAFKYCYSLSSVSLPEGLTELGSNIFNSCRNLKTITLPSALKKIGDFAFWDSGLTTIKIPDGVTTIGSDAFYGCSSLTSIEIPESVTVIEMYTFSGCTKLTSISLPKTLVSIKGEAFSDCSSLEKIVIPASVTSISSDAFKNTYCNFYLEASSIPSGWESDWNIGAYGSVVYYSDTPNIDGSHWHYDSDGKTPILWK